MDYKNKPEVLEWARKHWMEASDVEKKHWEFVFPDLVELTPFESALFSAFSDAWKKYMLGEPVNVAHWAKEHSEELLEVAKGDSAKWSEEDEKKITFLERWIRYNVPEGQYGWTDGHKGEFITKLEAISILKSLRPQPHWKPSEEQMKSLKQAQAYYATGKLGLVARYLESLYNDLKKLI